MKTDRELLALAVKAIGEEVHAVIDDHKVCTKSGGVFMPFDDGRDSQHIQFHLNMSVFKTFPLSDTKWQASMMFREFKEDVPELINAYHEDPRRAIVMCAAAYAERI